MALKLGTQTYGYADFLEPKSGKTCAILTDGIVGAGPGNTIIDLTGPIATTFPAWAKDETTRFNVVRVQGTAVARLQAPLLRGFTLRVSAPVNAPAQLFNGLRIAYVDGLLVEDVEIERVAGTANYPPYETFGLDLTQCTHATLRGVVVDGQGVSAAGIGTNSCDTVLLDSCSSSNSLASHGFAHWQSHNLSHVDCISDANGTGSGSQAAAGFSHEFCTNTVHVNSRARGNTWSYRYLAAAGASASGHKLLASYGDTDLRLEGSQVAADIDMSTSVIVAGAPAKP